MTTRARPRVLLQGVVKRFGDVVALGGIDLEAREGEILALVGPNGAGKTTALRVMLGLRRPDEGRARLFGKDPRSARSRVRVGATPQELDFPGTLRVHEILEFAGGHFPRRTDVGELVERFDLADVHARQVGGLSGGQRRRLAVALAFAGEPLAVFLDEPTTGLDVESRRRVWNVVRQFRARGGTVLLTTHYLEEAEALASRVVVIARGRIVGDGTPAEVQAHLGARSLEDALLSAVERER